MTFPDIIVVSGRRVKWPRDPETVVVQEFLCLDTEGLSGSLRGYLTRPNFSFLTANKIVYFPLKTNVRLEIPLSVFGAEHLQGIDRNP